MDKPILETEDLTVKYRDEIVLDKVNISIKKGSIVGIIGPNGSGKTSLFNALAGLLDFEGVVKWFGEKIDGEKISVKIKSEVAYQNDELPKMKYISVFEYLKFFILSSKKYKYYDIDKKVEEYLDYFWLREYKHKFLDEISKGTRQKLSFASNLVHRPSILILDEPTAGIDIEGISQLKDIFQQLSSTEKTIIISTHNLRDVEDIANRCFLINDRKIEELSMHLSPSKYQKYILKLSGEYDISFFYQQPTLKVIHHDQQAITISVKDNTEISDIIVNIINNGIKIEEFYKYQFNLEELFKNKVA